MVSLESGNEGIVAAKTRVQLARRRLDEDLRQASQAGKRVAAKLRKGAVPVLLGAGLLLGTTLLVMGLKRRRRTMVIVRRAPSSAGGLRQIVVAAVVKAVLLKASQKLLTVASAEPETEPQSGGPSPPAARVL